MHSYYAILYAMLSCPFGSDSIYLGVIGSIIDLLTPKSEVFLETPATEDFGWSPGDVAELQDDGERDMRDN